MREAAALARSLNLQDVANLYDHTTQSLPTKWELLFILFVACYNTVFSLAPWRTLLFWLLVPLVYCFIVFVIAVLPEHVDSRKLAFITGFFW